MYWPCRWWTGAVSCSADSGIEAIAATFAFNQFLNHLTFGSEEPVLSPTALLTVPVAGGGFSRHHIHTMTKTLRRCKAEQSNKARPCSSFSGAFSCPSASALLFSTTAPVVAKHCSRGAPCCSPGAFSVTPHTRVHGGHPTGTLCGPQLGLRCGGSSFGTVYRAPSVPFTTLVYLDWQNPAPSACFPQAGTPSVSSRWLEELTHIWGSAAFPTQVSGFLHRSLLTPETFYKSCSLGSSMAGELEEVLGDFCHQYVCKSFQKPIKDKAWLGETSRS